MTNASEDEDGAAVERNTARFLLDLGLATGGARLTFAGAEAVIGPGPIAYQNAVYRTRIGRIEADHVIRAVTEELDARGVPGSWHVGPADEPSDLVTLLQAHGFEDGGEDIGMAYELSDGTEVWAPPAVDTIHEVEGDAGLAAWAAVLADGFGEGLVEAEWAAQAYRRIGVGPSSTHRLVVARVDGRPAAAGASLLDGTDVGLYFIATRPAARRRGLATAVTQRLLSMGARSGARRAVLGASPAGSAVYARLGFREVGRTRILEYRPTPGREEVAGR
jgi:ribosomal protein S18 acetylase RimI-like enzyme